MRQKLALNMTANQLDVVIECLKERKIIENGLVNVDSIPRIWTIRLVCRCVCKGKARW